MTTPKHLYCSYDAMAQFVLRVECTPYSPEEFVEIKNRLNLLDPEPKSREVKFYDLGIFNDETMELKQHPAPQLIGDLSSSFAKLDAYSASLRGEGGSKNV